MPCGIPICLVIIGWYIWFRIAGWYAPHKVGWMHEVWLDHPATTVRAAIVRRFGNGERTFLEGGHTIDFYRRGDARVTRVRHPGPVEFGDIPTMLSICVAVVNGRTLMSLRIDILPEVRVFRAAQQHYQELAGVECRVVVDEVTQAVERQREASAPSADQSDYAALGLKPGASWEQVQTAYRDACLKYHPDRLTGQQVEPHLVELAVQRFKEVSAAYRRLKDHLAQPQHA
ncbi:MAG: J domain-containing protein [Planctomycetia bacterium]|nr:MAG: J domain-containing protein [Planctomycetia bacterium]